MISTRTSLALARAQAEAERERRRRIVARLDPLALADRAGFVPDPWQVQILQSTAPILLINAARQIGKSSAVGLRVTKTLQQPDKTILIFSPGGRQSKELLLRVLRFWRKIGRPVPHVHAGTEHLYLANGSRILALPGKPDSTVGFTPDLIIFEEAARTSDELYHAISPMSGSSGAPVIALSTPKGKRGWWYDLWHDEENTRIERVIATAEQYPSRYQPGFLAAERRTNPLYSQEYDCEFLDDERQAFASSDIAAAQVEMATWDYLLRESA